MTNRFSVFQIGLTLTLLASAALAPFESRAYSPLNMSTSQNVSASDPIANALGATVQGQCVPSANYAVVTTVGPTLCDASFNLWAISGSGMVTMNGVTVPSSGAVEIAYVDGLIWYENSSKLWWSWLGWISTSGTSTSPLPVTPIPPSTTQFTVTTPTAGATVSGTVKFVGKAGSQWVNIVVYNKGNNFAKVSGDVTPSNGAYTISVDTTQLANGTTNFAVVAYSAPAGQPGGTSSEVDVSLNLQNQAAPPVTGTRLLGIIADGSEPDKPQAVIDFGNWLGKKVAVHVSFGDQSSWANFVASSAWSAPMWKNASVKLSWAIPLSVNGDKVGSVANGSRDNEYRSVAQSIAANEPDAIIRLGWEFNGTWMPWYPNGDNQGYINAFRRVVGIFRAASPKFTFDWCPNWSSSDTNPESVYPGNDVVDIIGMDIYDQTGNAANDWSNLVNTQFGLAWHASFAAAHGKPMSYPEWGAGGFGDDPAFIQHMYDWINSHNVLYQAYWDTDSSYAAKLNTGRLPQQTAIYKQLFGK